MTPVTDEHLDRVARRLLDGHVLDGEVLIDWAKIAVFAGRLAVEVEDGLAHPGADDGDVVPVPSAS